MSHTPKPAETKMGLKALITFTNTFLYAEVSAKTVLCAETPIGENVSACPYLSRFVASTLW